MNSTELNSKQIAALNKYLVEHTADCDGDRARALREMADEPSEVGAATGIGDWRAVARWIAEQA